MIYEKLNLCILCGNSEVSAIKAVSLDFAETSKHFSSTTKSAGTFYLSTIIFLCDFWSWVFAVTALGLYVTKSSPKYF